MDPWIRRRRGSVLVPTGAGMVSWVTQAMMSRSHQLTSSRAQGHPLRQRGRLGRNRQHPVGADPHLKHLGPRAPQKEKTRTSSPSEEAQRARKAPPAGVFVLVFFLWCFSGGFSLGVNCPVFSDIFVVAFLLWWLSCFCFGLFALVFLLLCFCSGIGSPVFFLWRVSLVFFLRPCFSSVFCLFRVFLIWRFTLVFCFWRLCSGVFLKCFLVFLLGVCLLRCFFFDFFSGAFAVLFLFWCFFSGDFAVVFLLWVCLLWCFFFVIVSLVFLLCCFFCWCFCSRVFFCCFFSALLFFCSGVFVLVLVLPRAFLLWFFSCVFLSRFCSSVFSAVFLLWCF